MIDYCLNDVLMTKQLLDKIIEEGCLKSPKNDKVLNMLRLTEKE